ncbi:MAG: hypothetical protein MR300_07785, partial [Ruminococcus sp.]|nr:hypothetical protein [Ruminococcus sp.]
FQSGQMGQTVNLLFRLRWFESTLSHQDFKGNRCIPVVFEQYHQVAMVLLKGNLEIKITLKERRTKAKKKSLPLNKDIQCVSLFKGNPLFVRWEGKSLRLSIHLSVTVPTHNPLIVIVLNVGTILHGRAFHRHLHYSVCKHTALKPV